MAGSVPQPFRTIAVLNRVKLCSIETDFAFAVVVLINHLFYFTFYFIVFLEEYNVRKKSLPCIPI